MTLMPATTATEAVDLALRDHLVRVFTVMGLGLAATAAATGLGVGIMPRGGSAWIMILGAFIVSLVLIFTIHSAIGKGNFASARVQFYAFALMQGLVLAPLVARVSSATLFPAFLAASVTFMAAALWGYTTKRDLTGLGPTLFMLTIGLIVAGLCSRFIPGSRFLVNAAGVLIFVLWTAFDIQSIVADYREEPDAEKHHGLVTAGALELHLNMLNFFIDFLGLMNPSSAGTDVAAATLSGTSTGGDVATSGATGALSTAADAAGSTGSALAATSEIAGAATTGGAEALVEGVSSGAGLAADAASGAAEGVGSVIGGIISSIFD